MAKLFAAEAAIEDHPPSAVQLLRRLRLHHVSIPVERMMRDAKITEIYEGTSARSSAWSSPVTYLGVK